MQNIELNDFINCCLLFQASELSVDEKESLTDDLETIQEQVESPSPKQYIKTFSRMHSESTEELDEKLTT